MQKRPPSLMQKKRVLTDTHKTMEDEPMTSYNIRLSRISHPRGSLAAMLLLIIALLGFGVVAEACTENVVMAEELQETPPQPITYTE